MDINADYSGQSIGKYSLVEKLGRGSFGAVYKAFDMVLKVEKAIKILEVSNPTKAHELFIEAEIPYKCHHNNIVKINGGELQPFNHELHFIIDMELVNQGSLETLLEKCNLSVVESIKYIKEILFGIEFSHLQGIIHRDIKPANILINNGIAKVSDFGLSTTLNSLIIPWKWYCTHAAPETFNNSVSVATIETDIFSLGMTLYRMVNGVADWRKLISSIKNSEKLIRSGKLIDFLPFQPYIPKRIKTIIKKACKVDPAQRYHSAAEMRNAIEKLKCNCNWHSVDDWHWISTDSSANTKEIILAIKRKSVNIDVKNNGRRNSVESNSFEDIVEAQKYFMDFISNTTLV